MAAAGRTIILVLPALLLVSSLAVFLTARQPTTPISTPAAPQDLVALEGQTMGTRYRVLMPAGLITPTAREQLAGQIGDRLHHLDRELMSTYAPASELSRFNTSPPGTSIPVSAELLAVLETARDIHRLSGGAFDITVKPLVDLWGFGPTQQGVEIPDDTVIQVAKAQTGMDRFRIDSAGHELVKETEVSLDLSAIAKGYAVDQVAALLDGAGLDDYLVEIGGEVISRGRRPDGSDWRLGIEMPVSGESTLFRALATGGNRLAMAGSGSYRNFFMHKGQRYSHTIDPVTGRPVTHQVVSVTVIAESAMLADAWATALLVMGQEAGMKRANELQLAAYFIEAVSGGFDTSHTDAFSPFLPSSQ